MSDLVLIILLWLPLTYGFVNAYRAGLLAEPLTQYLWGTFFTLGLAFIFRAEFMAAWIDPATTPLTYWLRTTFFMLSMICYARVLSSIYSPVRVAAAHLVLVSAFALLINAGLLASADHLILTKHQAFYLMMTVQDTLALLYITFIYIPANLYLLYRERVHGTRLKHLAALLISLAYAATAVYTIPTGIIAAVTGRTFWSVPLAPIGLACVVIQFLPPAWIQPLLYPEYWFIQRRLQRVEATIRQLAQALPPDDQALPGEDLEQRIYQSLVNIQDYRQLAIQQHPEAADLYQAIDRAFSRHEDFMALARAIAYLRL